MEEATRMLMEIQKSTAETATNVHFLRLSFEEHKTAITQTLNEHIVEDKRILNEHIVPLLRDKEQAVGAEKAGAKIARRRNAFYSLFIAAIGAASGYYGGKAGN